MLLAWQPTAESAEYEVEYSGQNRQAVLQYRGPDLACFVTGLEEGEHYFRVRQSGGTWSEPVAVTVKFPPLSQVLIGLVSGALLLIITVAAIVIGYYRQQVKREDSA